MPSKLEKESQINTYQTIYSNYEEDIWTPDVERAFIEACDIFPPVGKTRLRNAEGKLCGRNELISQYIFKQTGKHRTRKQVSSHIQVLVKKKNRMKDAKENKKSLVISTNLAKITGSSSSATDYSHHGSISDNASTPRYIAQNLLSESMASSSYTYSTKSSNSSLSDSQCIMNSLEDTNVSVRNLNDNPLIMLLAAASAESANRKI